MSAKKKIQTSYTLLDGTRLCMSSIDARSRAFLRELRKMCRLGHDYFEVYRIALGPGSAALRGGARVDREIAGTPLYAIARDIVTRHGIAQGRIAPANAPAPTVRSGIWRHFKGKEYLVEGEFPDTETGVVHVAYRQLYAPYLRCSRTKANFLEAVDRPEFGHRGPRFVLVHAF